MLNPRERKRFFNDSNFEEELYGPYLDLLVKSKKIDYPNLTQYPKFFEQTSLMHLCERYKPRL